MNRRGFLAGLIGAAAAACDPERLLWVPGKKLISVPSLVDPFDPWPRWPEDYRILMIAPGLYQVEPARQRSRIDMVYFWKAYHRPAQAIQAIIDQGENFSAIHCSDGRMLSCLQPADLPRALTS